MKRFWLPAVVAVTLIGLLGGAFYWYSYRPMKIRQQCSWVEKSGTTTQKGPLRDDLTDEERGWADNEPDGNLLEVSKYWSEVAEKNGKADSFKRFSAGQELKGSLYTTSEESYHYWTQASDEEYKLCIRSKGLTR